MSYTIKNFKKFKGHGGEPLAQGHLCLDGKKVADWSDHSRGGELLLDFVTRQSEEAFLTFAKSYLAGQLDFEGKLHDLSKMDERDIVRTAVSTLSFEHEELLEVTRLCKKGMAWRAKKAQSNELDIFSSNQPYTARNVQALKDRLGDRLIEIFNEKLGLPLIDENEAKAAADFAYWKRVCAKATVFTLPGQDGKLVHMKRNALYSPEVEAALRKQFPGLVEILNLRYITPASTQRAAGPRP